MRFKPRDRKTRRARAPVREQTVGFRFDAFNALNIVSYGNPDTGITDNNFGNVSSATVRSQERRLQFSANYRF